MTNSKIAILTILLEARTWMYGLEIVVASEGQVHRGLVYVDLSDLEKMDLVERRRETAEELTKNKNPIPRWLFRITGKGSTYLRDQSLAGELCPA